MEFVKITDKNLLALKEIFGIKRFPKCAFCGKQTNSKNISIMPPLRVTKKLGKVVLCGSLACVLEYLVEKERGE